MGDKVQPILEKMSTSLDELENHHIFSKNEINAIIKKRRDFEFKFLRRPPNKDDFTSAIEYEKKLEKLRKLRKVKAGVDNPLKSDNVITSRILFIYQRATQILHEDLDLWDDYIEYCKSINRIKTIETVFSSFLSIHPRNESIVVKAVMWAMENGNIATARTVIQNSIRINSKSVYLYIEYYRMELIYIYKTKERRKILGLNEEGDEENKDFFNGEIPKVVFEEGSKIFNTDSKFVLKTLKIAIEMNATEVADYISNYLLNNSPFNVFPECVSESIQYIWKYHHNSSINSKVIKNCIDLYTSKLSEMPLLYPYYISFLKSLHQLSIIENSKKMIQYYSKEIKETYETALNNNNNNNLKCSYLYYLIDECKDYDKSMKYLTSFYSQDSDISIHIIYILLLKKLNKPLNEILSVYDSIFEKYKNDINYQKSICHYLIRQFNDNSNNNIIYKYFIKLLMNVKQPYFILQIFLQWCNMIGGNEMTENALDELISYSLPTLYTSELFSLYITTLLSNINKDENKIEKFFNLYIKKCNNVPEGWMRYYTYLREKGEVQQSNRLLVQAKKVIPTIDMI